MANISNKVSTNKTVKGIKTIFIGLAIIFHSKEMAFLTFANSALTEDVFGW